MNNLTVIEFLLVSGIVIFQTGIAYKTFQQIKKLRVMIPDLEFFKIKRFNIPLEDLKTFDPRDILKDTSVYEKKEVHYSITEEVLADVGTRTSDLFSQSENGNDIEEDEFTNEVSLINPNESTNEIFDNIITSTNIYLLRNKGAVTDFNLIKDIVERNVETEEEEITQFASVPLYLGLMGTMVGIVFGLMNLFLVSNSSGDFDPKPFLGGVSIAMFASFWGLFCSVANANFNYKTAKKNLEKSKNNFYTFIQTELLPIINQSISNSVYTLHQNLVNFNDHFTSNLSKLSSMLNRNHDALLAQERILTALENIDLTEFAKANVKVLKELKVGTEQLEKFNQYITNLSSFVEGTRRLSTSFEEMLSKTNNFKGLAEKLDTRIEESNQLVLFLNSHFSQLQLRGEQMKESVTKVEDILVKSLKQLEEHTEAKIKAIKEITIKEEDMMSKALADNRNNLTKLSLLEDLTKHISEFKTSSAAQIERVNAEIKELKTSLDKSNSVLEKIKNNNLLHKAHNLTESVKKIFSSKK
jgi:hypothetical protein